MSIYVQTNQENSFLKSEKGYLGQTRIGVSWNNSLVGKQLGHGVELIGKKTADKVMII